MRRDRNSIDVSRVPNAAGKSGVFAVDANTDDDSIIGGSTYVSGWSGMATSDSITDVMPPPSLLCPIYYDDIAPYRWS